MKHRNIQAFTKPARTEEKMVGGTVILYYFDVSGFVDIVVIIRFDFLVTTYTIRDLFHLLDF
jgi:hypothetical protein